MANITAIDPTTGNTRIIVATIVSSMIIQDVDGEVEYFMTLSTTARKINGDAITMKTIRNLTQGAGGTGLDRHGVALTDGSYADLSACILDYVGLMVNGTDGLPLTAMAFA